MRFRLFVGFLAGWAALAIAARAHAQSVVQTATLSADFRSLARLSLTPTSVSFGDADPDTVPQVPATGGAVTITAKARTTAGAQVLLTVLASDDLRSGVSVIPASAITWTGSGGGFVAGTLSKTTAAMVAQWAGSGVRTGTQALYFTNRWTYVTGTYTTTLTYTLTAP